VAYLYLFTTTALPDPTPEDGELIMIETGFEHLPEEEEISASDFEFGSTLVTTYPPTELTPEIISQWWEDLTGAPATIELLADNVSLMDQSELDRLVRLGNNGWSINSNFVAWRGSTEARREAVDLIRECSIAGQ
jgi:hypothetical protein